MQKVKPTRQGERKIRLRGTGSIRKQSGHKLITVNGKQVHEHRYIMEQHIGRRLGVDEVVHHLNGNKLDNRIGNLVVVTRVVVTRAQHKRVHDDIGMETRFRQRYFLRTSDILGLYIKLKSLVRVSETVGCSEVTIRRLLTKYLNKPLSLYAKERGWKHHDRQNS